jgi:hypothetical protein
MSVVEMINGERQSELQSKATIYSNSKAKTGDSRAVKRGGGEKHEGRLRRTSEQSCLGRADGLAQ